MDIIKLAEISKNLKRNQRSKFLEVVAERVYEEMAKEAKDELISGGYTKGYTEKYIGEIYNMHSHFIQKRLSVLLESIDEIGTRDSIKMYRIFGRTFVAHTFADGFPGLAEMYSKSSPWTFWSG